MTVQALTFRFAEASDAPAIVALVQSAYRGDASRAGWTTEADLLDGQRTDLQAVERLLATPESAMLLAESDGQLAGSCHLDRRARAETYLGMLAVRPSGQGRGSGRQILAEAERIARLDWGARTMVMTVIAQRPDLIAWYQRRGYLPTGETKPFPYGDVRKGIPRRPDLHFVVLAKRLIAE
ncbi:MAG TPA: GNAT family N-acetyltransferase [Streptosporangiaceae bacterium]|nr:GNAT family N-acetyltransferase [Streptosporangiaceae bacterium]